LNKKPEALRISVVLLAFLLYQSGVMPSIVVHY